VSKKKYPDTRTIPVLAMSTHSPGTPRLVAQHRKMTAVPEVTTIPRLEADVKIPTAELLALKA
jgi:hypothetical protein